MWLLPWLPRLSGWIVHSMHRITAIEGQLPADGPVLVVANHPSALMDPLVVVAAVGRPVRWLAKAPLVFHPVLGWLFRAAGCIPVFRRQDDPGQMARNSDSFRAAVSALAEGAVVAVFPEGISHAGSQLATLKTGAARLALTAARDLSVTIPLIPVGVIYRDAPTFRSTAGVVIGTAIGWDDLAGKDPEDYAVSDELTGRIGVALKQVTRDLSSWADQGIVEHAAAVLAAATSADEPRPSWVARSSGILATLEAVGDPLLPALRQRVRIHARALKRLEMTPAQLAGQAPEAAARWWRGWWTPLMALVWTIGRIWTWIPYRLTGVAAEFAARDRDALATLKAAIGILVFGGWIGLTGLAVGWLAGWPWGLAALPLAIGLALVTLQLEEARQARAGEQRLRRWRVRRRELLAELLAEQQSLATELGRVVERVGGTAPA